MDRRRRASRWSKFGVPQLSLTARGEEVWNGETANGRLEDFRMRLLLESGSV